jgi:hypothetical protein
MMCVEFGSQSSRECRLSAKKCDAFFSKSFWFRYSMNPGNLFILLVDTHLYLYLYYRYCNNNDGRVCEAV